MDSRLFGVPCFHNKMERKIHFVPVVYYAFHDFREIGRPPDKSQHNKFLYFSGFIPVLCSVHIYSTPVLQNIVTDKK